MTEKISIEIVELYNTILDKIEKAKPDKQKKQDQKKVASWLTKVESGKFPYIEEMISSAKKFCGDDVVSDKEELRRLRNKKKALETLYPELKE